MDGAGEWRELARGTTVGYRKVDRFEPTPARRVRVVVEDAVAPPRPLRIGLYSGA
jgi:alpha-L-fucosidase